MHKLNAEDLEAIADLVANMEHGAFDEKNLVLRLILALADDEDSVESAMWLIWNHLGVTQKDGQDSA